MARRGGKAGRQSVSAKPCVVGTKSAEDARRIIAALEEGTLDSAQVLGLMGVSASDEHCSDPGPKTAMKACPTCLCGLVPPEGGSRKKGLWASPSVDADALGPDPEFDRRQVRGAPHAGVLGFGIVLETKSCPVC